MDETHARISKLVKASRNSRSLTLRQFAFMLSTEEVSWSYQSVKNWEDGIWLPDYFKMLRVAEVYHDWRGDLAIAIVKELRPEIYAIGG